MALKKGLPDWQLIDLSKDLKELHNVIHQHPGSSTKKRRGSPVVAWITLGEIRVIIGNLILITSHAC